MKRPGIEGIETGQRPSRIQEGCRPMQRPGIEGIETFDVEGFAGVPKSGVR